MTGVWMLVADLDGTLLGDAAALERFVSWRQGAATRLKLVYASGRFVADVRQLIERIGLPEPDAIVGGVGTQIEQSIARGPMPGWCQPHGSTWCPQRVRAALERFTDLELQPEEYQSSHKVSYYARDASASRLDLVQAAIIASHIEGDLTYSSNRDVDVLPRGVSKGLAARFLAIEWGICARKVIVCGDSGNDLSMFQQGFLGIVVGNAQPELRRCTGQDIFHSRRPYAAGVIDGLEYWFGASADFSAERALIGVV